MKVIWKTYKETSRSIICIPKQEKNFLLSLIFSVFHSLNFFNPLLILLPIIYIVKDIFYFYYFIYVAFIIVLQQLIYNLIISLLFPYQ